MPPANDLGLYNQHEHILALPETKPHLQRAGSYISCSLGVCDCQSHATSDTCRDCQQVEVVADALAGGDGSRRSCAALGDVGEPAAGHDKIVAARDVVAGRSTCVQRGIGQRGDGDGRASNVGRRLECANLGVDGRWFGVRVITAAYIGLSSALPTQCQTFDT